MGRIAVAAVVALVASMVLGQLGDPRAHVLPVTLGLTTWGLVVVTLLGRQPPPGRDPLPVDRSPDAARRALFRLLAWAVLVRMPLYTWPPNLSDDVYRYVWEGRVWRSGFSPFFLAPDAPELTALRDDVWARVNHPDVSSIYPPLAQLWFVALTRFGVAGFKIGACVADLGTIVLLWRREPRLGWLWALLPLPALEAAGHGHLEALGTLLIALSLSHSGRFQAVFSWMGGLLKLLPAVLLLRAGWRTWLGFAAATLVVSVPLLGPGLTRGLTTYGAHWSFNGALWPLVSPLLGDGPARLLLGLLGLGLALHGLRQRHASATLLWVTGGFLLVTPTAHPWYALWPLVPALWEGVAAWLWLAALMPLSYLVWLDGSWSEAWPVRLCIWTSFGAIGAREAWRRWTRPGPG